MDNFLGNYYQFSLFLGGIIAVISSFVVYFDGPKEKENIGWFLSNLFAAIWSFGYLIMISVRNKDLAYLSNIVLHWAAILIPLFYFFFVLAITDAYEKYKKIFYGFSALAVIFIIINPFNFFVKDVLPKFIFNFVPDAGPAYKYFTAYFFFTVIYSLTILYEGLAADKTKKINKTKLKYIFIASTLGFAGGSGVFFLTFNVNIPPYAIALFSLYPIIITYAILKHHIFNVRVIATELFIFAIWIFLLFRVLLIQTWQDRVINGSLLFLIIIFGLFLIRSVKKEVQAREDIEKLAKKLEEANRKLKKFDEEKSEFLSIASHQLRTPMTVIKGYISMIMEGSFGAVADELKEILNKVYVSNEKLVKIIGNLLDLSRIERGKMEYNFKSQSLEKVVAEIISELKPLAEQKGLKLIWHSPTQKLPLVSIDEIYARQVILNLIDNAIKYTIQGEINVKIAAKEKSVMVSVKDSGAGIPKETMPYLFLRYSRGEKMYSKATEGMGLGLYVAKKITDDHRGKIWAESEGVGKGATFFVELPTSD